MTVSLCMIVRDVEKILDECLSSVEKYVDEIIIVDTGSLDGTKKVAEKYGAKIFDFNVMTHPDSFIRDDEKTGAPPPYSAGWILADFAGARNLSFEKATSDFVFWIDSDDIVEGAENLPAVLQELEEMGPGCAWFRYDYAFTPDGLPSCQLWRERIIRRGAARWTNPIHEVCMLAPGTVVKNFDNVVIRHRRDSIDDQPRIAHRNYKVLRRQYEATKDDVDPRTLFYLGNESKFMNADESIGYFEQYIRLSGWDEERSVARILLGQIYEQKNDLEAAARTYSLASIDFPSNPDAFFSLARVFYKKDQWAKCVEFTERGLALGNPHSAIMYNPLDRSFHPHTYYNVALNHLGRVADAATSCEEALKAVPEDTNLQYNKKLYESFLSTNPQHKTPKVQMRALSVDADAFASAPDLPKEVTAAMALHVWKELLRFDEVVKAKKFLENLPYVTDEDVGIKQAKKKTEEILEFATSPASLKKQYDQWHSAEEAIPFYTEVPEHWSQYPRYREVMEFFDSKPKLRVLDLGCQDGWLSNRVARLGHSVVGLDFSEAYLSIARRNAASENLDATYLNGFIEDASKYFTQKFDVVICTEVIEHVVDPERLLRNIQNVMKQGAALLLSTPKGAWFQGLPHKVASKWDEPRQHIQAFTRKTLRDAMEKIFHVTSCYEIPIPMPDVENQGTLFAVAENRAIEKKDGLDVVIYTGVAWEWWGGNSPYREGSGGSELAAIEAAKALVKRGHKVRVFSDCPGREGFYDGVDFVHFGHADREKTVCDIFIASRQAAVVSSINIEAKAKLLWVHDIHCGEANPVMHEALLLYDKVLVLSNWHRDYFLSVYPFLDKEKVVVTRNGILLERFPDPYRTKKNRLIYTSSGNRGLYQLLDLFPRVRDRVPDAELEVYYGFNVWRAAAKNNPAELSFIDYLEEKAKSTEGVRLMGRTNQQGLAQAWLEAKVWAYPTMFTETSCISAMEAQAAGAVPVTTGLAALNETVHSGFLLRPPTDVNYQLAWVDGVVELLTDEVERQEHVRRGRAWAEQLSWSDLASDWEKLFNETMEQVKLNPIHRYAA